MGAVHPHAAGETALTMKVLVACEYSGRVRDAFLARGHDAISCDLLPTASPGPHWQGPCEDLLPARWDLVIAFPPCTWLLAANAGRLTDYRYETEMNLAADLFEKCYNAGDRACVENPPGIMSKWFRKPDQYVDPWWFGDPWLKHTGLWLRGLPRLLPTGPVEPVNGSWVNGSWVSGGSSRGVRSSRLRSLTFQGLADAMAAQWG